jgi:hypothetical protein
MPSTALKALASQKVERLAIPKMASAIHVVVKVSHAAAPSVAFSHRQEALAMKAFLVMKKTMLVRPQVDPMKHVAKKARSVAASPVTPLTVASVRSLHALPRTESRAPMQTALVSRVGPLGRDAATGRAGFWRSHKTSVKRVLHAKCSRTHQHANGARLRAEHSTTHPALEGVRPAPHQDAS